MKVVSGPRVWHLLFSHCERRENGGDQLLDRLQSKCFRLAKGLDCRQARSAGRLFHREATACLAEISRAGLTRRTVLVLLSSEDTVSMVSNKNFKLCLSSF